MSDVGTEADWAADRMFGTEPSPRHDVGTTIDRTVDCESTDDEPVDLDMAPGPGPDAERDGGSDRDAGARKTAAYLGGGLLLAAVAITAVLLNSGDDRPAGVTPSVAAVTPAAPVPASPSATPTADPDRAIPYTASANCPAGSTSARSLTGTTSDSTWTCVRGQQGARVDGQVLHVDLGGSHVLTAVSITPGWVAKTPGAQDEWLRHRVVTRLQYVFDDADRTIFTQDTGNVRGPVTAALPTRVLASKVTVIVLQTSRPPASPPVSADPTAPVLPGFGDSVLGPSGAAPPPDGSLVTDPLPADDTAEDPVDATFSISGLTFLGHQPM